VDSDRKHVIVVHYNEIALKLGHRAMFQSRLVENLRRRLEGLGTGRVTVLQGRLVVDPGTAEIDNVIERLVVVPGVANVIRAVATELSMEAVEQEIDRLLETWRPSGTFRVAVKRSEKRFPLRSPEIGGRLGARIVEATGAPVDLKKADEVVHVEVTQDGIFVGVRKMRGRGGLPVGTGGRLLLLLSGGIDSPVAGLRMMSRGCRIDGLHFHSVPYLSRASQEKARALASILARGQGPTKVSMIAFGDIQSEIVSAVPRPLRVVLYRRMMMRISCAVARRDRLEALVTGESLGQVASQTLTNMSVIENAATLPVLRPLVGMEKREISDYARLAGTFEISIVPDEDCCARFVPKHPATAAKLAEVEEAEALFDVAGMVESAVESRECETIKADWGSSIEELAAAI
jgi:thiamine biosynthesis protein ThiI